MSNQSSHSTNRLKLLVFATALILVALLAIAVVLTINSNKAPGAAPDTLAVPETTATPTEESTAATEPAITKESTFTLSATGDILMHLTVINAAATNGSYDFDPMFTFLKDYVSAADLAVGNLETTLASTNNGYNYSGYPRFNCPDEIVDGVKNAGFDLLLTSNNHAYDTSSAGLHRTVEVVREKGLLNLGTKKTADEPNFLVVEEGGIKLGLACYTYETNAAADKKAPNGLPMKYKDCCGRDA